MSTFKSETEKKAKLFYDSCLDKVEIHKQGTEPLLKMIRQAGGWAVLDSYFDIKKWNFQRTFDLIHKKLVNEFFLTWNYNLNVQNVSKYILQISYKYNDLIFPTKDFYLNKTAHHVKILQAYQDHITKVVMKLGAKDENETKRQTKNIVEFEIKLAELIVENELKEKRYMTLKELQVEAGFVDWHKHFKTAFQLINKTITEDEIVVVKALTYVKNLTSLIKSYTSTERGKM